MEIMRKEIHQLLAAFLTALLDLKLFSDKKLSKAVKYEHQLECGLGNIE